MNQSLVRAITVAGTLAGSTASIRAQEVEPTNQEAPVVQAETGPGATQSADTVTPNAEPQQPPAAPERVVIRPGQTVNGFTLEALAKKGITWDLTPSASLRLWRTDEDTTHLGTVRLRGGVLLYNEPSFLMVGPSVQVGGVAEGIAFGGEIEAAQAERGVWVQGGIYGDREGVFGGACFGYTLFGLEYQRRLSGEDEGRSALFLNLHIPISIIRVALQPPPVLAR